MNEAQAILIIKSYEFFLKKKLIADNSVKVMAESLYLADFAVLSHDGKADPCFNYANLKAQELFEFSWSEFLGMPSRLSAEPDLREEREKMLAVATRDGFFTGYRGVRISKSGRRFFIDNCTIFNLVDKNFLKVGQAAVFSKWNFL